MAHDGQLSIGIVGAGISGIAAAYRLSRAFPLASIVVFEASDDVGGTWRANTYPGAACDVASHFYSLSFALNPAWSEGWASGAEIQKYLRGVAASTGVRAMVRFRSRVRAAAWHDAAREWRLAVVEEAAGAPAAPSARAYTHACRVLVLAPGALCAPAAAAFPGRESFRGAVMHTAAWRPDVPLAGRRVVVVGTGASAAQVVPAVAPVAARLTLLQRTPAWVVPRGNFKWSAWARAAFRYVPLLMAAYRVFKWLQHDVRYYAFIRPAHGCLRRAARRAAEAHLARGVPDDAALRRALTPRYEMGCKRVLVSDDLYPALARENVALVPSALARFSPTGVVCADGTAVDADVVVLATGFDVAASYPGLPVTGRAGFDLAAAWARAGGPEAYLGVAVAGAPNAFLLVGPNSGLGHSSIIAMIECQVHFVERCLRELARRRAATIEVRAGAHAAYNARVQRDLEGTAWTGCASWYNDGGRKNSTMWPWTVTAYWLATRAPAFDDFVFA